MRRFVVFTIMLMVALTASAKGKCDWKGKVEWGRTLQNDGTTLIKTDVYENGILVDKLSTVTSDVIGPEAPYNLSANLYYKGPDVRHMGTKKASLSGDAFLCAQSGSFFIGGYDELFWATEQSIVQLVNHNKRVV